MLECDLHYLPTRIANSCGGWSRSLGRASPIQEVVSLKPRRGYTPVSTQVDSGLHPLIRPVVSLLVRVTPHCKPSLG